MRSAKISLRGFTSAIALGAGMLAILSLTALPAPLLGESGQNEVSGRWFLNPETQNWSCSVVAGKQPVINVGTGVGHCKAGFRENLGYVRAIPLRQSTAGGDKYYFYVEEWGGVEGPGSECWGDSILIFELPYTADGASGVINPIYRGAAQPASSCPETVADGPDSGTDPDPNLERSHWTFHSVFKEPGLSTTYLLGQRVRFDGRFNEVWLGQASEGLNFIWSRLLHTQRSDLSIYGIYAIPSGGSVWRGYLSFSHPGGWGVTPVIVNRSTQQISYWTGDQVWTTVPLGGEITVLPYVQHHGFVTNYTFVRGRYELWFVNPVAKSGNRPLAVCPDDPYLTNNARWGNGQQPYYLVVDSNFNVVQPAKNLTSAIHPIPSDNGFSVGEVTRTDTLAGPYIYYGSQDWGVCNIKYLWPGEWSGSGIRVGRVADFPHSMFTNTPGPAENLSTGGVVYTVATQFSSTQSGKITQLGFHRATGEMGGNTLRLWTDSGTLLASVPTSCTSAGWCWGSILPPVPITAGTRYRVSVNTNVYQSKTGCGIGSGITNATLTAHSGFWIAGNTFPTTGSCSNFFVDVKFEP
jgi:hypothetical protein